MPELHAWSGHHTGVRLSDVLSGSIWRDEHEHVIRSEAWKVAAWRPEGAGTSATLGAPLTLADDNGSWACSDFQQLSAALVLIFRITEEPLRSRSLRLPGNFLFQELPGLDCSGRRFCGGVLLAVQGGCSSLCRASVLAKAQELWIVAQRRPESLMNLHGVVRTAVSDASTSACELGRAVSAVVSSFAVPLSTDFRNIGRVIMSRGVATTTDVLERTVKRVLEHHSRATGRFPDSMVKVPRLDLGGVAALPDPLGSGATSAAPTSAESPARAANAGVHGDLAWEENSDWLSEDHGHARLHKYRTICSEIVPGSLYLSGYGVACDRATLRSHDVTHIVNTAADVCDNLFVGDFEYLTFYLKDSKEEPISAVFHVVLEWIDAAIAKNGVVLVHCREGVSRSATITMAYLMWKYKHTLQAAHDKVVRSRSIVCPNAGFLCQLLLLEKLLRKWVLRCRSVCTCGARAEQEWTGTN